ncbi:tetratricopeptide repeat protein [Bacillus sp. REN16]|uniref:tetratricopeptide repeat protein n=1 Tax=Bacillus sp. REN16 TaxID=2887296 RepID=UPI001E49E01C|nr:tetratricopeptide repeat protein [Bacillus sp. REN16]MCC3356069.1 tetratricopeptide repeat protein [Bacillus sp. REN16]
MKTALQLRKEGRLKESNERLLRLLKESPEDPQIHYQVAWSFDVLGLEGEAVPFYKKAIELGLQDEDLEGALLGLGSTYRTLGEYEKSEATLLKGTELFPENHAMKSFYAMTLYNLERHQKAMELLLKSLAETARETSIQKYKRAIEFYADKLDETWK